MSTYWREKAIEKDIFGVINQLYLYFRSLINFVITNYYDSLNYIISF